MAFNGSGSWTLPAGQPVVTGTVISSSTHNTLVSDIQSSFGTVICKDGQTTVTANLPMAGFKFTGLGAGSAAADSPTLAQVQNGFGSFLTAVAGTNTITATATPTPTYTVGQLFTFIPANTNSGATTLNISSLGAGAVQANAQALVGGELVAGVPTTVYVSAATPVFQIVGSAPFIDSRPLVVGGTDQTKKIRFEVDGLTTATTRVLTVPDVDFTVGALNLPQNSQSAAYTTVLADAGKHILHPAADTNARTFTIDSNANVAYPLGTAITFVNQTANVVTIAITTDTMTLAGTTSTGSRSLAQNGIATAIKITTTSWIINGTGLS